jgi:carbamoyl-phosphate synthase small subunit
MTASGYLLLEDGRRFVGVLVGGVPRGLPAQNDAPGIGEVVFQTGMTGYQEVITDPSYRGQIVTFTASHIGNTGVNAFDNEASGPALAGIVVRSLTDRPSSWRSEETLTGYLDRHEVPCLTEVDTRALTRHLREMGALRGVIAPASVAPDVALARVKAFPGLAGRDLVREVAPSLSDTAFRGSDDWPSWLLGRAPEAVAGAQELADEFPREPRNGDASPVRDPESVEAGRSLANGARITLVHCGMKEGIDAALRRRGARVRIVAPSATPEELLRDDPDGILLSNGPGDPDALTALIASVRQVIGRVPVFGICLGHQVLALALGARTYKMKYGHHGINHPVKDLRTGRILITSQNHGFAVDPDSLRARSGGDGPSKVEPTHLSLNDQVLEGFHAPDLRVRAVQFHPEANAGPRDARPIFEPAPGPKRRPSDRPVG